MRALMLAFAYRQQYHVLRSATAAGYTVEVLGKDCARGLAWASSCAAFHPLKFDASSEPLTFAVAEISDWIKRVSADIILPSDIVSTRLLAAIADRLPAPSCALPDPACFDRLNDKLLFYNFCNEHDVPVPQTWLFDDAAQLREALAMGRVPLPIIVKPHNSMGGRGILPIIIESDISYLEKILYTPVLAQTYLIGEGIDISVLAHHGRIVAYAIQRNLPEKISFVQHDKLLEQAAAIVSASNFHGIAHFDAIDDKSTGEVRMLECNPRFWLSLVWATLSGLNFVELSLESGRLNPENPRTIANTEVPKGGKLLVRKWLTKLHLNDIEWRVLKYKLSDPLGAICSGLARYDDGQLEYSCSGSIEQQVTSVESISRSRPIALR